MLGKIYYERNQLDEAEAALTEAMELLVASGPVSLSEGLAARAKLSAVRIISTGIVMLVISERG